MSRVRERSSSASSSWTSTQFATSWVARTRPAEAWSPYAASEPTTRSSVVSGTTTAYRIGHSGTSQVITSGPSTCVRPSFSVFCAWRNASAAW
jgi:hypothetical protein